MEAKTETQLPPHEVHSKLDDYEREQPRLMNQKKHMAILRNDHTHDPRTVQ